MRDIYGNAKEIETCDTLAFITGHKPNNGAQPPCGLSFYEIESIRKQKFLGPLQLFPEDSVLPDWKEMVKFDENLDADALEICRSLHTKYKFLV